MKAITDERIAAEVKEYMAAFISERFPGELHPDIETVVREIVFDAFVDGVAYGQDLGVSRIIKPGRAN